jgi:hypothetical protein
MLSVGLPGGCSPEFPAGLSLPGLPPVGGGTVVGGAVVGGGVVGGDVAGGAVVAGAVVGRWWWSLVVAGPKAGA